MNDNSSAFNSKAYNEEILRTIPFYLEIQEQITGLVQMLNKDHISWLDTGCGTGTLALAAAQACPVSEFVLCDPSRSMLQSAKQTLSSCKVRCAFNHCPSQNLPYSERFDVVTAVQAHHYLSMQERLIATKNCYAALKPEGMYITFENFAPATSSGTDMLLNRWKQFQVQQGKTEEEAEKHIERYGVDCFPITVSAQLFLLRQCGFTTVELFWLSHLQAGFFALKPPA